MIADRVKAPAPNAMEDRSMVIHKPQGTVLLILVTMRPLVKTSYADISPIRMQIPRKESHARKPGEMEKRDLGMDNVVMARPLPWVGCSTRWRWCRVLHAIAGLDFPALDVR